MGRPGAHPIGAGAHAFRGYALAASLLMLAASPHVGGAQDARRGRARPPQTSRPSGAPSASAGAYTATQAARGEKVYRGNCSSCHAATAYTGATFTQLWVGRTAYDMFNLLRRTMPNDDPGRLSRQQYADVVAYLFRLNGYPSGAVALPTEDAALKQVRIDQRRTSTR